MPDIAIDEHESRTERPEIEGQLRGKLETIADRLRKRDNQRRAMLHIMIDLAMSNQRLSNQRKALLHILVDYERDRRRVAFQAARLDNSRRALLHLLQDSHRSKAALEASRKAMIHIMGDLRQTTIEVQRREQELRDKQEQLVQAGKLATLGELSTGIAHELNNPLNNIGLFVGNAVDLLQLGGGNEAQIASSLRNAMRQVRKGSEIISHLRTFGRAAPVSRERISMKHVIDRAISLMQEQFKLRQIEIIVDCELESAVVLANPIQLEQVFINLLTNARDAVADSPRKAICISGAVRSNMLEVTFADSGPGIPSGLERRIFDPFYTTKQVGKGTGLGLSITYGIIRDHGGTISVLSRPQEGATFLITLPLAPSGTAVISPT